MEVRDTPTHIYWFQTYSYHHSKETKHFTETYTYHLPKNEYICIPLPHTISYIFISLEAKYLE